MEVPNSCPICNMYTLYSIRFFAFANKVRSSMNYDLISYDLRHVTCIVHVTYTLTCFQKTNFPQVLLWHKFTPPEIQNYRPGAKSFVCKLISPLFMLCKWNNWKIAFHIHKKWWCRVMAVALESLFNLLSAVSIQLFLLSVSFSLAQLQTAFLLFQFPIFISLHPI